MLATKVGMDMGDGKVGLAPAYIRQAVDDSLRRLQTDRIDLYQAHQDDPKTPLEETLAALADSSARQGARHRRQQLQRRSAPPSAATSAD